MLMNLADSRLSPLRVSSQLSWLQPESRRQYPIGVHKDEG